MIERTRDALQELIFGWDMEYDEGEIRDEVRLVKCLLDLLWAQMPEGLIEEQRKHEEAIRVHVEEAQKRSKKKAKKKEAK